MGSVFVLAPLHHRRRRRRRSCLSPCSRRTRAIDHSSGGRKRNRHALPAQNGGIYRERTSQAVACDDGDVRVARPIPKVIPPIVGEGGPAAEQAEGLVEAVVKHVETQRVGTTLP